MPKADRPSDLPARPTPRAPAPAYPRLSVHGKPHGEPRSTPLLPEPASPWAFAACRCNASTARKGKLTALPLPTLYPALELLPIRTRSQGPDVVDEAELSQEDPNMGKLVSLLFLVVLMLPLQPRVRSEGPELVFIEGGVFLMGDVFGEDRFTR